MVEPKKKSAWADDELYATTPKETELLSTETAERRRSVWADPELSGDNPFDTDSPDYSSGQVTSPLDGVAKEAGIGVGVAGAIRGGTALASKFLPFPLSAGAGLVAGGLTDYLAGNAIRDEQDKTGVVGSGINAILGKAGDVFGGEVSRRAVDELAPKAVGSGRLGLGRSVIDEAIATNPRTGAILDLQESFTPGSAAPIKQALSRGARFGEGAQDFVASGEALAKAPPVEQAARVLGVDAFGDNTPKGFGVNFRKKSTAVIDDPRLWGDDVTDLSGLQAKAKGLREEVGTKMAGLSDSLAGTSVSIEPLLQKIEAIKENAKGWARFAPTEEWAKAYQRNTAALEDFLRGPRQFEGFRSEVPAQDLLTLNKLINDYEATYLGMFDSAAVGKKAFGDEEFTLVAEKGAEAFDAFRDTIKQALDPLTDNQFSALNSQYGGFSALEDAASKAVLQANQGMAQRSTNRMIPTAGDSAGNVLPETTGTMGIARWAANKVIGGDATARTPESLRAFKAATRPERDIETIKQARALSSGESVNIPRGDPTLGAGVMQRVGPAAARGAVGAAGYVAGAGAVGGAPQLAQNIINEQVAEAKKNLQKLRSYTSEFFDPAERAALQSAARMFPGQVDPYPQGLPRTTDGLDPQVFAAEFLARAPRNDPAMFNMAVSALNDFRAAVASRNNISIQAQHERLAESFPQLFAPGHGVNGKVTSESGRRRLLGTLEELKNNGTIDDVFLAEQTSALNDPSNRRVIPIPNKKPVTKDDIRQFTSANKSRTPLPDGSFAPTR